MTIFMQDISLLGEEHLRANDDVILTHLDVRELDIALKKIMEGLLISVLTSIKVANMLLFQGRPDDAIRVIEQAQAVLVAQDVPQEEYERKIYEQRARSLANARATFEHIRDRKAQAAAATPSSG